MRVLIGPGELEGLDELDQRGGLSDDDLRRVYAAPSQPWLRVNMVSTLDGSATGSSGLSGSINNGADHRVFHTLRAMADAILVGAGTARAEGYRPGDTPIVLVSRRAEVPETLREGPPGSVLMATVARAEHLDEARAMLGAEHVLVAGTHRVDLAEVRAALVERGWTELLCEGGPHLLRDLLDQGVADELTTTIVPRAVGGTHPRITDGAPVDVPLRLHSLLEEDGTLLGRWLL